MKQTTDFLFYTLLVPFRLFLLLFKSFLPIIFAPAIIGAIGIVPPRCLFLRLRAMIFFVKMIYFDYLYTFLNTSPAVRFSLNR